MFLPRPLWCTSCMCFGNVRRKHEQEIRQSSLSISHSLLSRHGTTSTGRQRVRTFRFLRIGVYVAANLSRISVVSSRNAGLIRGYLVNCLVVCFFVLNRGVNRSLGIGHRVEHKLRYQFEVFLGPEISQVAAPSTGQLLWALRKHLFSSTRSVTSFSWENSC